MDQRALTSGTLLSGRYRLQDLIDESGEAFTWLARDEVLSRRVGIQAVHAADRRALEFTLAARRSTVVTDPHFLRVLDIVEDEHDHTFLVREWARALSLEEVLQESTLTNLRSATVVAEVAEALASAHDAGVYHRHLDPRYVLVKDTGAVRIIGLAVEHALNPGYTDVDDADVTFAEQLDVTGIGNLLYACLTGRWPGGRDTAMQPAPREHGRLLRPRQVRAGVSRDVDAVCDRILGTPPRHHESPLRSARDIAHLLRLAGEDEFAVEDDQPSLVGIYSPDLFRHDPMATVPGPPPAVNPPKPRPAALQPRPPTTFERNKQRALEATRGDRLLVVLGVVGGLALISVLAFIVGRASTGSSPPEPITSSSTGPTSRQEGDSGPATDLAIVDVTDFDPEGADGGENPDSVGNVTDGDPYTSWRTSDYYGRSDLGGLKDGVGLMLDLGSDHRVTAVQVTLEGAPTDVRLFAARPGTEQSPENVDSMRHAGSIAGAPAGVAAITVPRRITTRYVLVWFTDLPEVSSGVYRGTVSEVSVRGVE